MIIPKWPHHCAQCLFIGHWKDSDVYICPQVGIPTIMVRYGAHEADYASGAQFFTNGENFLLQSWAKIGACVITAWAVKMLHPLAAQYLYAPHDMELADVPDLIPTQDDVAILRAISDKISTLNAIDGDLGNIEDALIAAIHRRKNLQSVGQA